MNWACQSLRVIPLAVLAWSLAAVSQVTVKTSATVRMGDTLQFTAPVTGGSGVIWKVNGKVGGTAATGTISSNGLYVAPLAVSGPLVVKVTAVVQGTKASSTALLTVEPCVPAPAGLVSWWAGERSGQDVYGPNSGTITGGVTFVPGGVGLGFNLDGSTGYVNVPDSSSLDAIQQAVGVEMWVIPQPIPATQTWAYLYSRRDPLISENFSVYILTDGTLGVLLRTTTSPDQTGSKFESAPGAVLFGQLQHIAATADVKSSSVGAYVNAVNVPLAVVYGPVNFSGTLYPVSHLFLGRRQDVSAGEGVSGAAYFPGVLDEVSLYSTALSQPQIQAIYQAGPYGKCR